MPAVRPSVTAAVLTMAVAMALAPAWAADGLGHTPQIAGSAQAELPYHFVVGKLDGALGPGDVSATHSATGPVAQAAGAPARRQQPPANPTGQTSPRAN